MGVAFVLAMVAAVPEALVALWLALHRARAALGRPHGGLVGHRRARLLRRRHLAARHHLGPAPATLPGQGDDRARVPRRPAAGDGVHSGPSRAAGLPGPAVGAAHPDVRAGPHVHVGVQHARLHPAPGRHGRAARLDQPVARPAGPVRPADRAHHVVAAGGRARRPGAGARRTSGWPRTCSRPPPPPRRPRRSGCSASATGSAGTAGRRGSAGTPRSPRPGPGRPSGTPAPGPSSGSATSGAIVFVTTVLHSPAPDVLLVLAAGAQLSAVRQRHRRRDRLPARDLDGRLAPAGLARGLRGVLCGACRRAGPRPAHGRASGSRTSRSPTRARPTWCCAT